MRVHKITIFDISIWCLVELKAVTNEQMLINNLAVLMVDSIKWGSHRRLERETWHVYEETRHTLWGKNNAKMVKQLSDHIKPLERPSKS